MAVSPTFSRKLLLRPEAKSQGALQRISLAMLRLPNVLDTNSVANLRTLEQKISDGGPTNQRVDPHLLRLALMELVHHRKIVLEIKQPGSSVPWYANTGHNPTLVNQKLDELAPLYEKIAHGNFPNLIGDALEVVVFKCIEFASLSDPRCNFLGSIDYKLPKDKYGRFKKWDPPTRFMYGNAHGPADFLFNHPSIGGIHIECKNVREWLYPDDRKIKELLKKCCTTGAVPLMISRRIHYSTISNLFEPAGIMSHESYQQYYPEDELSLIDTVKDKRSLGFSDVRSWEDPNKKTERFFLKELPILGSTMADKFRRHKAVLAQYANGSINRAELYRAIGSPAASQAITGELPDGI